MKIEWLFLTLGTASRSYTAVPTPPEVQWRRWSLSARTLPKPLLYRAFKPAQLRVGHP